MITKLENRNLYYGIFFFFLYGQVYSILSRVLITPIWVMHWNIHFIGILLLSLIALMSVWFYRIKEFPKLNVWFILLVVVVSVAVNFFNFPDSFLFFDDSSVSRNEVRSLLINYITGSSTVNLIVFLAIAYSKYSKEKER